MNNDVGTAMTKAIAQGQPSVLLETAVMTCGLPRTPWDSAHGPCPDTIDPDAPVNLAVARSMIEVIDASGVLPVISAVIDGHLRAGIDDDELTRLAADPDAGKASIATLGVLMARRADAGTTVSGALRTAEMMRDRGGCAPRVMATGGIGGVHDGWPESLDLSADLGEIARSPICVVCAGAKSIIDAAATRELLEALGVPVLGLGTRHMPRFQAPGDVRDPDVEMVEDMAHAADIARHHWSLPHAGGLLLAVDPPSAWALTRDEVTSLAATAQAAVDVTGGLRTPALLAAMADASGGATLRANVALLVANARHAAALATALV